MDLILASEGHLEGGSLLGADVLVTQRPKTSLFYYGHTPYRAGEKYLVTESLYKFSF